jgi:hypothetical protein
VKRWPCQFWAGCTTNISEREFPTGTPTIGVQYGPNLTAHKSFTENLEMPVRVGPSRTPMWVNLPGLIYSVAARNDVILRSINAGADTARLSAPHVGLAG